MDSDSHLMNEGSPVYDWAKKSFARESQFLDLRFSLGTPWQHLQEGEKAWWVMQQKDYKSLDASTKGVSIHNTILN